MPFSYLNGAAEICFECVYVKQMRAGVHRLSYTDYY